MEGVFPGYYGFGLTTIAMALALVLILAFREPAPLRWGTVALLVLTLVGTVYAGHVLLPEARAARLRAQAAPAGDLAPLEFSRLHRRAVAVNITIFLVGAIALTLHLGTAAGGPSGQGEAQPRVSSSLGENRGQPVVAAIVLAAWARPPSARPWKSWNWITSSCACATRQPPSASTRPSWGCASIT